LKSNCIAVFFAPDRCGCHAAEKHRLQKKGGGDCREPLDSVWMAPRFFTDQVTAGVGGTLQRILVLGALCCNFPMA